MRNTTTVKFLWIALCIAVIGCGKAMTEADYLKMTTSKQEIQREQAAYFLVTKYKSAYFNYVYDLAQDPDVSVRRAILRNITQTKDARFVTLLKRFKTASDPIDRQLASEAIESLEKLPK